jgi:putative endonuclease
VRCKDGSLYTGICLDVEKRLREHRNSGNRGAKYLRGRGPLALVLKKKIGKKSLALKIEMRIKKLEKAKKEALLTSPSMMQAIMERSEKPTSGKPRM